MRLLLSITLSFMLAMFAVGCGNSGSAFDGDGGDGGNNDGTVGSDSPFGFGDTGSTEGGGCVGLQCQQTCPTATITGTVYDPANINGLYNVFVYVPNDPLDAITDGPICAQCQAPASGSPVVSATTDYKGNFTITNPPIGTNLSLVMQLGKWRRHITNLTFTCGPNPQADHSLRFPQKQHETSPDDNIPLMAMTTGCDSAECFFLGRIGIDKSEFTDGVTGTGRVRMFISPNYSGGTFPGVTASSATLFTGAGEMAKFDIIFDACECDTYDRGGAGGTDTGYKNFLAYLNQGGRAFTTHYYYNFFASATQCFGDNTCQGQAPLPTVGAWEGNQGLAMAPAADCPNASEGPSCLTIDTAIPKGVALAQWYQNNNTKIEPTWGGEKYGFVGLTDIREDMGQLSSTLVTAGTATPWLYANGASTFPNNYDAYYFSFNTPVGTDPTTQCGRAIYSDVHLDAEESGSFPSYCPSNPDTSDHAPNELALEFLFFDLSSCVQNDTQPPPPPPF
jgi:hypothetical protein